MASTSAPVHPARYLTLFLVMLIGVYLLVFLTGDKHASPKLGIDLQGGTRVTLTARTPDGSAPTREALNQAQQIISARVNGLGVSGSEVIIDGSNLVITVPGNDSSEARNLGQTARLYIRPVIHAIPAQGQGQQPPTAGAPGAPGGAPPGMPPGAPEAPPPGTPGIPPGEPGAPALPPSPAEQVPPQATPAPQPRPYPQEPPPTPPAPTPGAPPPQPGPPAPGTPAPGKRDLAQRIAEYAPHRQIAQERHVLGDFPDLPAQPPASQELARGELGGGRAKDRIAAVSRKDRCGAAFAHELVFRYREFKRSKIGLRMRRWRCTQQCGPIDLRMAGVLARLDVQMLGH